MIVNKYVQEYIDAYSLGEFELNEERIMLLEYLERDVFSRADIYFDDEMIEKAIRFTEKWYFDLTITDKFLYAFVFLYFKENRRLFYRKILWLVARGFGKNGKISALVHFLISPLHGINEYNVSLVANSEEQAMTSFKEVYGAVGKGPALSKMFKRTKTLITSNKTLAELKYRTSNGETKDGLRDGAVVFDEIHQYESNKDVAVHISGLGKKANPREFYIGTDGYVREGFLDGMKELSMKVLKGEARVNAIFPFICKLDNEEEVDNPKAWEKANPMLCEPRNDYARTLYDTIYEEYENLQDDPSTREEFLTKRMNLPVVDLERSVAKWEEILATNRELPSHHKKEVIGCIDFASIRDFAACGLLYKVKEDYCFYTHSFALKEFVDKYYGYSRKDDGTTREKFAPIREWEQTGLLTVLNEPTIDVKKVVEWFVEQRKVCHIKKIISDNFRMELLRKEFEDNGFEIEVIKNPRAIHSLLAPRIETAFANNKIIFGDNPLMRWYTNNVLVVIDKKGNKFYEKIEAVRRKTDGFQAFVHGMYRADELSTIDINDTLDFLNAFKF